MSRPNQIVADRGRTAFTLAIAAAALAAVFATGLPGDAKSSPFADRHPNAGPALNSDAAQTMTKTMAQTIAQTKLRKSGHCRRPKHGPTKYYRALQNAGWKHVRYRGTDNGPRRCQTTHSFTACRGALRYLVKYSFINGRSIGRRIVPNGGCFGSRNRSHG
jgi:hypothetical protein